MSKGDGRGSLYQIGLSGAVPDCNRLSFEELAAVVVAVRLRPFPLGSEGEVYTTALEHVRKHGAETVFKPGVTLPQARWAIAHRYAGGMNAPYNTYVSAAIRAQGGGG